MKMHEAKPPSSPPMLPSPKSSHSLPVPAEIRQPVSKLPSARAAPPPPPNDSAWSSLLSVVSRLDGVVRLIDDVARVHPYLNAAWLFLSIAYKTVQAQQLRDQNVQDLVESMIRMYSFVEYVDIRDRITPMAEVMQQMGRETVECAKFIERYNRKTVSQRMMTSILDNVDAVIAEFKQTFETLRNDFDTGLVVQNHLGIRRIQEDINRLFIRDHLTHVLASWDPDLGCLSGTRRSILEEIMTWIVSVDRESKIPANVFWLSGLAGSGKSSIAHTLAEFCAGLGILGSGFFFKHDEAERNRAVDVFSTMAIDLAAYDPRLAQEIAQVLKASPSISGLRRQFLSLVADPIRRSDIVNPMLILIDALDECGPNRRDREEFLMLIAQEAPKLPPNIRIIISSRPDEDIVDTFQRFKSVKRFDLDLQSTENHDDLASYVSTKLSEIAALKSRKPHINPEWPEAKLRTEFVQRTAGLFIWASTALETIKDSWDPHAELLSLIRESAVNRGAQETLHDLYRRTVNKFGQWDDPNFARAFRTAVGAIIVLRDPLSPDAIDNLIGDELGAHRPDHVFSVMGSVLRIVGGTVRLLHPSFSDFLTDGSRCHDERQLILPRVHHYTIAQRCVGLMTEKLKRNIADLPDTTVMNSEIADLEGLIRKKIPRELQYACEYWVDHIVNSDGDSGVLSKIALEFLSSHALEWIEVLSLTQSTKDLSNTLENLRAWAQEQSDGEPALVDFLTELKHFSHVFASVISGSSGHIYSSALPFIPLNSRLKTFLSKWSDIPIVTTGRQINWPLFATLRSHTQPVIATAFSPDSTRFASASWDKTLCIWDTRTHDPVLQSIEGHADRLSCLAYSPDGRTILSGSYDRSLKLWSSDTGEIITTLSDRPDDTINSVSYSSDGLYFASSSVDGTIHIWRTSDNSRHLTLKYTSKVYSVAFSPDSSKITCGTKDGSVMCWAVSDGSLSFRQDRNKITNWESCNY
ncbi:WD40 repeat-like protein [Sistotremastrum suecicum HHB10207 ss-3]|uniref:WD40 repeat-like protein n=1 Tax=Sistotremastrum suecicum HHB10207 ss-3 TaxID=1314776 RepID=A0A165YW23_9AGAM|nr:WD40 repeat-like protein [Sistotremastrum suecicum HHB10207 ss-3]